MPSDQPLTVHLSPADRRVAEVQARLQLARQNTHSALVMLRVEVTERSDWRTWVRLRPGAFLLTAFVAGFLMGRRR